MKYLFKLGHQPDISTAEIFSVFEKKGLWCGVIEQSEDNLFLSAEEINSQEFMDVLGGTVLIAENVDTEDKDKVEKIASYLNQAKPEGKVEFAISGEGVDDLLMSVKNKLREKDRSARFVDIKNTASIKYNNLVDSQTHVHLYDDELYITKAIQPFEEMKKRDYERPKTDSESGMLPPKLARIMINLSEVDADKKLMDPFCGSGTVLTEAASLGFKNIVGSDVEEKAISDTKDNLDWIKEEQGLSFEYQLYDTKVENISKQIKKSSIDCIVTEPFLGEPRKGNEDERFLKKQMNNLRRLYIDAFHQFSEILTDNAIVVFIIPKFKYNEEWLEIGCVSEIEKAGFKQVPFTEYKDTLFYARPDQLVGREIHKFKLNK